MTIQELAERLETFLASAVNRLEEIEDDLRNLPCKRNRCTKGHYDLEHEPGESDPAEDC